MIVKGCDAEPDFRMHYEVHGGLGEQTEFCVGGPSSNSRTAAHLRRFLPGVTQTEDALSLHVGGDEYGYERGEVATCWWPGCTRRRPTAEAALPGGRPDRHLQPRRAGTWPARAVSWPPNILRESSSA